MSTCAFCGDRCVAGCDYLAYRMTSSRIRTVKVCSHCVAEAQDAGYYVTEREPAGRRSHAAAVLPARVERRYQ